MDELILNPLYEKVIENLMENKYSIADDFFTDSEIEQLRSGLLGKYETESFKKSAIGNQLNEKVIAAVRGDFIMWIDENTADTAEQLFFDRINDFTAYLNRTCYMGINESEFHYAVYPPGTFYKRHLDTFQNDKRRKLSMVCYLNDENWQPEFGGQLTIYTNNDSTEQATDIYPVKGRMVIFESQLLEHEVKPVNRQRLSITGWLKSGR